MESNSDPASDVDVVINLESGRCVESALLDRRDEDDGYEDDNDDDGETSTGSTMSDTSPPLSSSPLLPSPASLSYYVWDRKDRRTHSLKNFAGLTLFSKRHGYKVMYGLKF
ncbi:hypothetical protein N1851_029113 [Merluccius polli]|uniref:Uncharacterized protein n=1 Tax=Merluccius polli TaxID=89951 RepID=A0AA47M7M3_MERPO|nr:hypothetical protein N1851_029113 [Merluccius polli]